MLLEIVHQAADANVSVHSIGEHFGIYASGIFSGATGLGVVSHIVQTFPIKDNRWVNWIIGIIQYVVGQRERAVNTLNSNGTLTIAATSTGDGNK